jgi:hypothetical protein
MTLLIYHGLLVVAHIYSNNTPPHQEGPTNSSCVFYLLSQVVTRGKL